MAKSGKANEAEAGAQPKSGNKMLMIGGVVAVLAAGGGGFYVYKQKSQAAKGEARKVAVFLDLPEIMVNLAPTPGQDRTSVMKLKVSLELAEQKNLAEIQPLIPRVQDNFQVFLRELKAGDLEGSAGVYRLKEELIRRVNAAVHPARVEAVLFKDLLVQ